MLAGSFSTEWDQSRQMLGGRNVPSSLVARREVARRQSEGSVVMRTGEAVLQGILRHLHFLYCSMLENKHY